MKNVTYRGYRIVPAPVQLRVTEEWTLKVYLRSGVGSETLEEPLESAGTFRTREEAVQHCIQLAKQVIDGRTCDSRAT